MIEAAMFYKNTLLERPTQVETGITVFFPVFKNTQHDKDEKSELEDFWENFF